MDEFLAGIARETNRVTREEQGAAAEIERITGLRAQLSEKMKERQMELETVTGERRATESNLATQRKAAADLRNEADLIRRDCSHLQARKESIENVLLHHSYTGESVKKLLGAMEQGRAGDFKPHGLLADFIEVETAYERAAEEFLQDELEYVVVGAWEDAERGMQFLRSDLEGRATFLVESNAVAALPQRGQEVDLPRLADHVRMTNGLSQGAANLLPKLSRCYIAASPQQARDLSTQHPDLYFLLDDGQFYRGQTLGGGRKKASGPLALKRESRELGRKLAEREGELQLIVATLEKLTQEIAQMEADLERLRALQQAREKDAVALDHEMRKVVEEGNRANSRVSVARLELERLNREQLRAVEQRDRNRAIVAQKEEDRSNREAALDALRQASEDIEAEAGQAAEAHSALRAQLAALEERYRAAKSALGRLEQQHRDMSARRQEIGREIERLGENRNRLLAENIELDKKSGTLAEAVLSVESTVLTLSAEESKGRSALQAADAVLKDLRSNIEALHGRRSEIEVDLVRRQAELKYLDDTSQKELGCALLEIENTENLEGEALDDAERTYKEVKAKVEALGPINPEALAEYEDAQQRHDFLTTQRQDLLDSIRDTEQAIQEIDRVSKTRFNEAFEAVNAYFRETFQTLFGGGMGEMRLTDENNAGESGIDIIASPPGKKLQNVLLLSGGEKALAALSLLMAIFRYQPSPFCVLDEVDAPLDEANILRLTKLLTQMSENTQFIMITHSKKTMESAQAMYGVTMQEAGVSKLVSVKFGAQGDRAAVA
jgi:chromosome segregation protein